jgi:hypothetical protein
MAKVCAVNHLQVEFVERCERDVTLNTVWAAQAWSLRADVLMVFEHHDHRFASANERRD